MGPDEASYQGKKRHDKQLAMFKAAMAKKKTAASTPAPKDPSKTTYGLGKAGISTVVDLGKNPTKKAVTTAHAELRANKPSRRPNPLDPANSKVPTVKRDSSTGAVKVSIAPTVNKTSIAAAKQIQKWATAKKSSVKAKPANPERPPYVFKQDNKLEFKALNVGKNAAEHQKYYGDNPAPLLPKTKVPKVKAPSVGVSTPSKEQKLSPGGFATLVGAATLGLAGAATVAGTIASSNKHSAEIKAATKAVGTKPSVIKLRNPLPETDFHYGLAADSLENRDAARREAKGTELKAAFDRWNDPKELDLQQRHDNRRAAEGTKLRNAFEAVERADARAKAAATQVSVPDAPKELDLQQRHDNRRAAEGTKLRNAFEAVERADARAKAAAATQVSVPDAPKVEKPTVNVAQVVAPKAATITKPKASKAPKTSATPTAKVPVQPKATGPKVVTSASVPVVTAPDDNRLGERRGQEGTRRDNATRFTKTEAKEAGVETPANKITTKRAKGSDRRGKTPTPTLEEIANLDPQTREALIHNVTSRVEELDIKLAEVKGETPIPQVTAPESTVVKRTGRATRPKKSDREYWREKNRQAEMRRNGLDPNTGGVLPSTGRDVIQGKKTWVGPDAPKNVALSSTNVNPAPVDKAAEEIGKLRGKKAAKVAAAEAGKTKTSAVGETGVPIMKAPNTRSLAERSGMTEDQIAARTTVLEPKIDPISSGQNPQTERAARHVEAQTIIEATQAEIAKLNKDIAAAEARAKKAEAKAKAAAKKVGRGERTAESFQPGGNNIADQLASPENADVKRVMRVGMEGGGKWDEKPAEFKVEEIIGKELEDLKARARGDRRTGDRRSGLAGDIEKGIDAANEQRQGTRREPGVRRVADAFEAHTEAEIEKLFGATKAEIEKVAARQDAVISSRGGQEKFRTTAAAANDPEVNRILKELEGVVETGADKEATRLQAEADKFLRAHGEGALVEQTRDIYGDTKVEPEQAEKIIKRNSLDELRRVSTEAADAAATIGNDDPNRIKTRAELEAELAARKAGPGFRGDLPSPRPGTGQGMFAAPTVAEEMEAAKVSNRLRARLQGNIQGMPVERRAGTRKVQAVREVERRVEIRGPQRQLGRVKVPNLATPDMGQQLSALEGRPGSQYIEKPNLENRRNERFQAWNPEGTSSEEATRRVMENYARRNTKARAALTTPWSPGSDVKTPMEPYTGADAIKTRRPISTRLAETGKNIVKGALKPKTLVKGALGLIGGGLAFTVPEVASAYMDVPGDQQARIKAAGETALEGGMETAAGMGIFTAGVAGASKLLPAAAPAIGAAAEALAPAVVGGIAGSFAGNIYSRVKQAQEKKARDTAHAKEKYGTVEAATRTRKGQKADGTQLNLSDVDRIMSRWEKEKK